jgi:hypothetical protein
LLDDELVHGGEENPPIAAPEVEDDVVRRDRGEFQHLSHHLVVRGNEGG